MSENESVTLQTTLKDVVISYGRTMSQNFQGRRATFGFTLETASAGDVHQAFILAKAVVDHRLGQKLGLRRIEIDVLATKFLGVTWSQFIGSAPLDSGNELL